MIEAIPTTEMKENVKPFKIGKPKDRRPVFMRLDRQSYLTAKEYMEKNHTSFTHFLNDLLKFLEPHFKENKQRIEFVFENKQEGVQSIT